jgi:microcystin-dependent protein
MSVAVALGIKLLLDSLFIPNGILLSILGATMLSTSILLGAWYGGRPGERVGLTSMRGRVTLLSGSLQIRSEPGVGPSVVAEVPLPATGEEKEANDEG